MDHLRVYLSSAGPELQEERATVAAFLTALSHVPVRYEDFAREPISGREACRRGVEGADVLLLLFGSRYVHFMADSRISPAEEEYNRARELGRLILAFKQREAKFEPAQREFVQRVEREGRLRALRDFTGPLDLAESVLEQFEELKSGDDSLRWVEVSLEPRIRWLSERIGELPGGVEGYPVLELFLAPERPLPARSVAELSATGRKLADSAREVAFFSSRDVIEAGYDPRSAWAIRTGPDQPKSWNAVIGHPYAGLFADREGGVLAFQSLPRDIYGTLVDAADLSRRLATLVEVTKSHTRQMRLVVPVAALEPADLVGVGDPAKMGNRSGRGPAVYWQGPIATEADTGVDAASLRAGSADLAQQLANRLAERLRSGPAEFMRG